MTRRHPWSNRTQWIRGMSLALTLACVGCSDGATSDTGDTAPVEIGCREGVRGALVDCSGAVNARVLDCYSNSGSTCPAGDAQLEQSLASLETTVLGACADDADVAALGYPAGFTRQSLVAQLQQQCQDTTSALVARTLGGPHAPVWSAANADGQACLRQAVQLTHAFILNVAENQQKCLADKNCSGLDTEVVALQNALSDALGSACMSDPLSKHIGLSETGFITRATQQAGCHTSQVFPSQTSFSLDCGPRPTASATQAYTVGPSTMIFDDATDDGSPSPTRDHPLERGQYVQVELDFTAFGTRCGDGSNYRFWIQLAPEGGELDNLYIYLQGGGKCLDETECNPILKKDGDVLKNSRLDDQGADLERPFTSDATDNPFRSWSKVILPYCTQDLHAGGGTTQSFSEGDLYRYGGVNVRTALRYARDAIWAAQNAEGTAHRSADFEVVMHGTSGGCAGTFYNYQYVLDELGWRNTLAVNNGFLPLDNGSMDAEWIAAVFDPWAYGEILPPYCFSTDCIFASVMSLAHAQRLGEAPLQHIAWVSYQLDEVQAKAFSSDIAWANALRQTYCDIKDTNHMAFWLPAKEGHVVWEDETSDGVSLSDWLDTFVTSGVLDDQVEDKTPNLPGAEPFPCTVN